MKMKKITAAFTLSAILISSVFPQNVFAAGFADVAENAWYAESVDYVTDNGLMVGISDNEFDPDGILTRGMFITVLHRLEDSPQAEESSGFTDVNENDWFSAAVNWGVENGLTSGTSSDRFEPYGSLTREQLAVFLQRYYTFKGENTDNTAKDEISLFSDRYSISDWAEDAVAWAYNSGIIIGVSDSELSPKGIVTRAQTAVILYKITGGEVGGKSKEIDSDNLSDDETDSEAPTEDAVSETTTVKRSGSSGGGSSSRKTSTTETTTEAVAEETTEEYINLSDYENTQLYYNGTIYTVDEDYEGIYGDVPTAESVLVGNGKIIAVAYTDSENEKLERSAELYNSKQINLDGKTVVPAFQDAHSHLDMADQYPDAGPAAGVTGYDSLISEGKKALQSWLDDNPEITSGSALVTDEAASDSAVSVSSYWFVTHGYDNTAFKEDGYAHPTRQILDEISTEYPIVYIHTSDHMGVVNTAALKLIIESEEAQSVYRTYVYPNWDGIGLTQSEIASGIADGTFDIWDHFDDLTGLLRENGFYQLYGYMGGPYVLGNSDATKTGTTEEIIAHAMELYASYGITTGVIGGGSSAAKIAAVESLYESGEAIIDIQHMMGSLGSWFGEDGSAGQTYESGSKVTGVKIFQDGSPQGKTAWFSVDENDPDGAKGGYYKLEGEIRTDEDTYYWGEDNKKIEDDALLSEFVELIEAKVQFTSHCNGTGAIQQFIDNYETALKQVYGVSELTQEIIDEAKENVRPTIIHAQTATADQVKKCSELGISISFFTDHVYYFGDYHLSSTLGPVRGQTISPMATALSYGDINVTMHQDTPVAVPNMLFSIYNAVNRITRDGEEIGHGAVVNGYETTDERIDAYNALKAVTINSAWQNFDENEKGSITEGKQADFAILSIDPLSREFSELDTEAARTGAFVVQTINDGNTVYTLE
ncbi:MAG: amidohydrolase family protein [Clostridiales bacterium]|nr:amidohydrolase family protein [Clostridiales bacterium]